MTVAFLSVHNNATSTLAKAATSGATEVELIAGGHTSFPAAVPFDVSIDEEILHVTKVTGDVFTVTRGAQETTAAEHLTGAQCQLNVTAKSISDLNEAVNNIESGTTDLTAYAKLAGRGTGQKLIGGTAAENNLELQSTSNATRGAVKVVDELIATAEENTIERRLRLIAQAPNVGAPSPKVWEPSLSGTRTFMEPGATVEPLELEGYAPGGVATGLRIGSLQIWFNRGTKPITLINEAAVGEIARFRFSTGANIVLEPKHTIIMMKTNSGWIDLALR